MKILFIGSTAYHVPSQNKEPTPDDKKLFSACKELGYYASSRGHTILIGSDSKNTIDFHIMEGVLKFLSEKPNKKVSVEIHRPEGPKAIYTDVPENLEISKIQYPESFEHRWIVSHVRALDSCDVLITLGGGASTRLTGNIAADRQKPIISVGTFGGASYELYNKLIYHYKNSISDQSSISYLNSHWSKKSAEKIIGLAESLAPQKISHQVHTYFISNSWDDSSIADHVELLLLRRNRHVKRDEMSIEPGTNLSDSIKILIQESDTYIGLWSKNFNNSDWCSGEHQYAIKQRNKGENPKRIVFLLLDNEELHLTANKYLQIPATTRNDREVAINKLLENER